MLGVQTPSARFYSIQPQFPQKVSSPSTFAPTKAIRKTSTIPGAQVRGHDSSSESTPIRGAFIVALPGPTKRVYQMKELVPIVKRPTSPGVLAVVGGLILIASGVTSGSIFLTGLGYVNQYLGPSIGSQGDLFVHLAIAMLTFIVGLGGILVVAGGVLLLRHEGFAGRLLIGLGGGMAVFGLLFSMFEALYVTGFSAPVFHQTYFTLYWLGSIIATIASLLSDRAWYASILTKISSVFSKRARNR